MRKFNVNCLPNDSSFCNNENVEHTFLFSKLLCEIQVQTKTPIKGL